MRLIAFIIIAALAAEILLIVFVPAIGWGIAAFLAFLLLFVLFIPVGARLRYVDKEFTLSAKISRFELKLLPKKKKSENSDSPVKEKNQKAEKHSELHKEKKKLDFSFDELLEIAKKAIRALGKFGKLTVHKFMLHYMAAGNDPYKTAMTYGYVNSALSALAPVCKHSLRIKNDVDVCTSVDFLEDKTKLDAELCITIRPVQLLHVALIAAFGILPVLIRNKRRIAREKRAEERLNKNNAHANNTEENKTNIDTEERMDSNG